MRSPSPTIQFLQAECRRTVNTLCFTLSMSIAGGAGVTAIMMFRGFLEPAVANSLYALCSIALIGLGLLYGKSRNPPTLLGTAIAILAAAYIFFQAIYAHPDQWVFLVFAFGILVIGNWAILVLFGNDFLEFAIANSGWFWRVVALIYTVIVFSIPFGLILLAIKE